MHLIIRSLPCKFAQLAQAVKPVLSPVLLAGLLLAPASLRTAHAQSATTGAIGGVLADSNGALLPGSVITVTSVETGAIPHGQEQLRRRVSGRLSWRPATT